MADNFTIAEDLASINDINLGDVMCVKRYVNQREGEEWEKRQSRAWRKYCQAYKHSGIGKFTKLLQFSRQYEGTYPQPEQEIVRYAVTEVTGATKVKVK